MAVLLEAPYSQFFDSTGTAPLAGGKVYTYSAGTTTPKATYTDYSESTPAANPIILDSAGRAAIWATGSYRFDVKTSGDVLIRTTDNYTAYTPGGDMTKAVYDPANVAQQVVGTAAVQNVSNKTITASTLSTAPGSTTVPPIAISSGTNLTAAVAGSVEYDGKVAYFTPQGTQRGILQAPQEIVLQTAIVGTNVNTAQSPYGLVSGFTLSSATIYEFEGMFALSKTAGTTAHVVGTSFTGTAVLANTNYNLSLGSGAAFNSGTNIFYEFIQTAANTAVSGSSAAATWTNTIYMHGFVAVTTGGTFNPSYTNSAAPGGAYTTSIGSFFKIWPVGATGANINVGTAA